MNEALNPLVGAEQVEVGRADEVDGGLVPVEEPPDVGYAPQGLCGCGSCGTLFNHAVDSPFTSEGSAGALSFPPARVGFSNGPSESR
jgi:hypothetical protein